MGASPQSSAWHFLLGGLIPLALAACGGGGGPSVASPPGCTAAIQKQAILDIMTEWYFFNDEPEQQQKYLGLNLNDFVNGNELLDFLRFRPQEFDRNFSFQSTAAADQQFFGDGEFVGFGFGTVYVDAPTDTDLRFTQVFAGSPAAAAGIQRGFRLLAIDGLSIAEINQGEGISAAFGPAALGVTRTLRIGDLVGGEFDATLSKALVTIDPVPLATVFDVNGASVGYLDFRTFIATANNVLDQAFASFEAQGITALIVDLRYNGGGLVGTGERLGDLIGGFTADGRVFSETRFNTAKSAQNTMNLFGPLPGSLTLLQQVVLITTASTASASEMVINSLEPHTVVTLVGAGTFGKPVGQSAFGFCDNELLLRPVTFETVNSLGQGRFYAGLPVDCDAADELELALGDPAEASLATALSVVEIGACPVAAGALKPSAPGYRTSAVAVPAGAPAEQRLLGAF